MTGTVADVTAAVCTATGLTPQDVSIAFGKPNDKSTWTVTFLNGGATPAQQNQALTAIANFDLASVPDKDVVDLMDMLQFKVMFNHENRIRVLEGKAAITAAQFKTALRAL